MEKPPVEQQYDTLYSEEGRVFCKPDDFVAKIPSYITTGRVLELGAGQGRNALWLAKRGFQVDAQDISQVGIEFIKKKALERGLSVSAVKADARQELDGTYDVIVSIHLLYNLNRDGALKTIDQMKDHTQSGGLNVICTFTKDGDFFRNNPEARNFFAELGELREIYSDWEILEYEEIQERTRSVRVDGSPMFNITAKIIARKP